MTDRPLAFDGAEGYGASTVGGRGGQVLHVTNLNDSGTGSLRWALETVAGPRIVVFDVGGVITLKSQILVQNGNVTIAGQTAPGQGITLEGSRIRIKADEVIVRGMHFRPGDGPVGMDPGDRDGLMIGTTDFTMKNIVIDHNSFSWAIDENVSINGFMSNVTFSNNLVAEGLSKSIHPKGEHSKGLLISNWEGTAGNEDSRISVLRNLFSDNVQRNPEVRAGQQIELINNYVYDYGLGYAAISVGGGTDGTLPTSIDLIGNVIEPGRSTPASAKSPINVEAMGSGSRLDVADNVMTAYVSDAHGNQDQAKLYHPYTGKITAEIGQQATSESGAAVLDSTDVRAYLLANAGAVNGSGRDSVDQRVVGEVAARTGSVVDKSGTLDRTLSVGPADTDRDGMPDWFETFYGFDPARADDKGDRDGDGYTNVEEYINGLISGFTTGAPRVAGTIQWRTGADIPAPTSNGVTLVKGFHPGGSDKLDIGAMLQSHNVPAGSLGSYLELAYANGNTYVSIDSDGSGAGKATSLLLVLEQAHATANDIVAVRAQGGSGAVAAAAATATAPAGGTTLYGTLDNDVLAGGLGNDLIYSGAGNDTLIGGEGSDGFYFGAALTAADYVDGGSGASDQLGVQGDYSAGLTLGPGNLVNIEALVLMSGDDVRFGDTGGNFYSYNLATSDANVAAGQMLTVNFNALRMGENVTFNGSPETDGSFLIYGGQGADAVVGGQRDDGFFFGQGRFSAGDTVDGQGGNDQLGLQGDYTGANAIVFAASQLVSVESIVLLPGSDGRFSRGGVPFSYDLTLNDANVASGAQLVVNANTLQTNETLRFNGSAETNGQLRVFGGADDDFITGGAGADQIWGRGGADTLSGGGGADTFSFLAGDSTSSACDSITDFARGDKLDFARIDAVAGGADDPFAFIGAAAFDGHTAGQLRCQAVSGNNWLVEADTNGDGLADIKLALTVIDAHSLTAADFLL